MFDINAKRGYQESVFLQALGINLSDLEPKANMCTKVGNSNISILTSDSDELFLREVSQRTYLQHSHDAIIDRNSRKYSVQALR